MRTANRLAWAILLSTSAACEPGGATSNTGGNGPGGDGTGAGTEDGGGGSGTGATTGTAGSGAGFGGDGGGGASGCAPGDCPAGETCGPDGECIAGCSASEPCNDGLTCCDATCVDVQVDLDYCGSCTNACDDVPNQGVSCVSGVCDLSGCDAGFFDCDGNSSTGCESASPCVCTPNATQGCYTGPPNTQGIGACQAGTQTCGPTGQGWGPCLGQVLPDNEICANGVDEDCSGLADDVPDLDGDGWTVCQGDCCDSMAQGCTEPAKVNPGAYEASGNNLDDDCNPATTDAAPTNCSMAANFNVTTGVELAQAMDICTLTTLQSSAWGLIAAELVQPSGSAIAPNSIQLGVMTDFGVNTPQLNATMAAISSGTARDPGDPGYIVPDGLGWNVGADNTGWPPSAPGVGTVNDGVNLRLTLRAPTNAQSFSFKFKFFSAEYPEWVTSQFNDTFLALLTSTAPGIPADKNISFDAQGGRVDVNNGFFEVCSGCASGDATLAGTGYTSPNMAVADAGATNWLTTSAPITPGEVFTIEYMIFDVADHAWDSLTLLDSFEWSINPSQVGTVED
jgi:hypothetical protein